MASGSFASFQVTFAPQATSIGNRVATISVANDDADENPYDFAIQGNAGEPEINLQGRGLDILNGDTTPQTADGTDFGTITQAGSPIVQTFVIQNLGNAVLNLTDSAPHVTITGANPGDFTVTTSPSAQIVAGGTSNFQITFEPLGIGTRNATVSIANDDADENPYTFAITGNGGGPEINLQGNSIDIVNGDVTPDLADGTDFGTIAASGNPIVHTFVIQNTGNSPLNLTGASPYVSIVGANPDDFTVTTTPASQVAAAGATSFQISFKPLATGTRNATVSIANDDADENPYTFAITGNGGGPEINLQGNSIDIVNGDATPAVADGTDFGTIAASGNPIVHTFVIQNTGNSPLNLTGASPYVSIIGANPDDFTVTTTPASQVAAAGATSFQISFKPLAIGTRNATVSIANDDADENPYTFAITGNGGGPEINLQGNSIDIVNGDATPAVADGTDFGTIGASGNPIVHTFVIQNTGNAVLNLTGTSPYVSITGANPDDFTVTTTPASQVAAAGATSFQISFKPLATGTRNATVSIDNDDADENPYTFAITGNGGGPEINLQGNSIDIVNGDVTPDVADGTDFGTIGASGNPIVHTFVIQNTGNAVLNLTGVSPYVSIGGANPGDFTVTTTPANQVAAEGATSFQISFKPLATGTRSATVSIANDDADENPYTFAITGNGGGPEINLQGNSVDIVNGDATPAVADGTDFGTIGADGNPIVHTFVIQNTGNAVLNLTGTSPYVSITGANPDDFTVTTTPANQVAAEGATSFQISFKPLATGTRSATVSIANDDADENPYTFAITGNGGGPEINLQGNSVDIVNGDVTPDLADGTDFGAINASGNPIVHTFVIQNTGNAVLNLTGTSHYVSITGANPDDFTVTTTPANQIAAEGATSFQISFKPLASGQRTATVSIANDDADENPYTFAITGNGGAPEINLQGNSIDIANGDATPAVADGTDFGTIGADGNPIVRTFVIQNTGNAVLNLTDTSPYVSIVGANPDDFTVTTTPASQVAAAGATSFQISFKPLAIGTRNATVSIANDDADENPYTFAITGNGGGPEINLQGNSIDIANGDATPAVADGTDFGTIGADGNPIVRTFVIQNTGNAVLNLTGTSPYVSIVGANPDDFTVTTTPASQVAAAGATSFQISFKPLAIGTRNATVSIDNDDADENPYTFAITGNGGGPEINLRGHNQDIVNGDVTPEVADGTDFGTISASGNPIVNTFVIHNTGNAVLNLTGTSPYVNIVGANPGDFTVTTSPDGQIAAEGATSFQISFKPLATGTRNATVSIANDDADENPYTFAITGNGGGPEINLQGNNADIVNGDVTPDVADGTDFGTIGASGNPIVHTFVIQNTGNAVLNLTGNSPFVSIIGANPDDFTVTTTPANQVAAEGATSFQISFKPLATGTRTATVSIANDDADENPYTFAIAGNGGGPEINLQGNNADIVNGDVTPDVADGTDFGPIGASGNPIVHTFVIQNTGNAVLNLTGTSPFVNITGANPDDFTVTTTPANQVAAEGATSFQISFKPLASGQRTATVSIANDDADENPYTFAITGNGGAPEINLQGSGVDIVNGDATPQAADGTDFGTITQAGTPIVHTFVIQNTGNAVLNLTDNAPHVAITGANPNDFTVTTSPAAQIAANGASNFQITFSPLGIGTRNATVSIANDDTDENPYTFAITGNGGGPEINLEGNGNTIVSGDTTPDPADGTDFGTITQAGTPIVRTFAIQNTGNAVLNLTGNAPHITITGANPSDFTITSSPATQIAAGGATSFQVTFQPLATGTRNATVSIANDDADENPYTFAITGNGGGPEINLQGNSITIVSGDTTPQAADGTDFGTISAAGTPIVRTFAIQNTGDAALNLTGIAPYVAITGAITDFAVIAPPANQIAAAGATSFQIIFIPTALGVRNATVSIANDDADENPYTFAITGNGGGPEIDVQGNDISIPDGDTTPAIIDGTDFGTIAGNPIVHTFVIENTGTNVLTLSGVAPYVTISGANSADFTVTSPPMAQIAANSKTSFQITFNPTGLGTRTATVSIANDDPDETPYDFSISGNGGGPEIDIQGNGISIPDGDTTPQTIDNTDFGSVTSTQQTIVKSFVILNTGNADLNLTDTYPHVSISGAHAADFTVTSAPAAQIAPGGTSGFQITFTPSATGNRNATVSVASNDTDENPYTFDITANGGAADIFLSGNGNEIVSGDTTPDSSDGTDFGFVPVEVGSKVNTFTIQNIGGATLNLSGNPVVSISGANAADFTVIAAPANQILVGSSSSFSIKFDPIFNPLNPVVRQATVSITNNDPDENPYTFSIQGTAAETEINLTGNNGLGGPETNIIHRNMIPEVANGTDFGIFIIGSPVNNNSRTYTIYNLGTQADLYLTGTPIVRLQQPDGTEVPVDTFEVTTQPAVQVIPTGLTTTFTITFNDDTPATNPAPGTYEANVYIANNDYDEDPYTYRIICVAQPPDLEVLGNNNGGVAPPPVDVVIPNGDTTPSTADTTDFGNVGVAGRAVQYILHNTGATAIPVTINSITITPIAPAVAADFTVTLDPSGVNIASGASEPFEITCTPQAQGTRSATVTIDNTAPGMESYTFMITAFGVVPEIQIEQFVAPNTIIVDGDNTPSTDDDTDWGSVSPTNPVDHVFRIRNLGNASLNITVPIVDPDPPLNFTVTGQPIAVLPAGSTTSFTIRFNPQVTGLITGTVVVISDDPDEGNYDFAIQGTGDLSAVAEIGVSRTADIPNNSTEDFGNTSLSTPVVRTYTITNTGGIDLTIPQNGISITGDASFTVSNNPSTGGIVTVTSGGGTATFELTFNPATVGVKNATLNIVNNDLDENPFVVNLTGTGITAPAIEVRGIDAVAMVHNAAANTTSGTDFGTIAAPFAQTFPIHNTGSGNLTIVSAVIAGDAEFTITTPPTSPVLPGGSTNLGITFTPGVTGSYTATVSITHDDSNVTSPFVVNLAAAVARKSLGSIAADGVHRVDSETSSKNILPELPGKPAGIAMDEKNARIYWTDTEAGKIQRANWDGSNLQTMLSGLNQPVGIDLDADNQVVYWASSADNSIKSATIQESTLANVKEVIANLKAPRDVVFDAPSNTLYWAETGVIAKAVLNGRNMVEKIVSNLQRPYAIALDRTHGKIYWTEHNQGLIQRANLDGSNVETLVANQTAPSGLALNVEENKMYWSELSEDGKLFVADLQGQNIKVLSGKEAKSGQRQYLAIGKMQPKISFSSISHSSSNTVRGVQLTWKTNTEIADVVGYHIWRSEKRYDGYECITKLMIQVQDGRYKYSDMDALPEEKLYYYQLQIVYSNGKKEFCAIAEAGKNK